MIENPDKLGHFIAVIAPTFADAIRHEAEILRRRLVHATRPCGPMSMEEAVALCRRMDGNGG